MKVTACPFSDRLIANSDLEEKLVVTVVGTAKLETILAGTGYMIDEDRRSHTETGGPGPHSATRWGNSRWRWPSRRRGVPAPPSRSRRRRCRRCGSPGGQRGPRTPPRVRMRSLTGCRAETAGSDAGRVRGCCPRFLSMKVGRAVQRNGSRRSRHNSLREALARGTLSERVVKD